jgi:hypothetical protein
MHTLRIEHQIRDFDSWKAAFDSDQKARRVTQRCQKAQNDLFT